MLLRGERRPEETSGDQKRPVETIILSDLFVGRQADSRNAIIAPTLHKYWGTRKKLRSVHADIILGSGK